MRRKLIGLALCMLLAAVLAATVVCACRVHVLRTPYKMYYQSQLNKTGAPYSCVIVPGAGILDGKPGIYLRDRLDTALTLYQSGASDCIVLSGAADERRRMHETDVMFEYLLERGVPASAVIMDHRGVDTAQTVLRARAVAKGGRVIICTQSLYVPRTAYLARCFGLEADFADSDIHIYTDGVLRARLRETLAAVKAVYEGYFVPENTYSVELYPLTGGEGNV